MSPTLDEIKNMAYKAGEILRAGYGQAHQVEMKGLTDPVTEVDKRSEEYLVSTIKSHYPEHAIVAEESGIHEGTNGSCWYIDPLDGTVNFSHGIPMFCVSIAYAEHGELLLGAVYDPLRDELYCGEKGKGVWLNDRPMRVSSTEKLIRSLSVTGLPYNHKSDEMRRGLALFTDFSMQTQACRRLGSAALDLCYVAAGRMDIYFEIELHSYDIAAGVLLAREAGGMVTKFDGSSDCLKSPISIAASNKILHPQVLKIIQQE
jgi:myo-inositol-1(or 4)-monophosphatase